MSGKLIEIVIDSSNASYKARLRVVRSGCGLDHEDCRSWKDGFCLQDGNGAGSERVTVAPGSKSKTTIGDRPVHCGDSESPEPKPMDLTQFLNP